MNDIKKESENTILVIKKLINEKPEWISRYEKYGDKILANLDKIKKSKEKKFHEWAPLYLYMNVSAAMGNLKFSLRYLGQDVAKLKVGKKDISVSTKGFDIKNDRHFGCKVILDDCEWRSIEAKQFRNHFSAYMKRTLSGKKNEEHRLESLLLTEFSKTKSKDKILCNIQPVKLAGISRFQMPTPLSASDMKKLKYSGASGGGIDIISRVGIANGTKLCVMELKDEYKNNEPPSKVIQQGLVYATFIHELLRSRNGKVWWKIFGFGRELPQKLEIIVTCIMPTSVQNDISFDDTIIPADDKSNDSFHLHYIYFKEENNRLIDIDTSLKQCKVKKSI